MYLVVDHASSIPIYQQIRAEVVAAIARGELQPGDRLPSVRMLASDLGVNLHTVNKAYAMLRDEGYLVMRGRSGASVADVSRGVSSEAAARADARVAEALRDLAIECRARGVSRDDFMSLVADQAALVYAGSSSDGKDV